MVEAVRDPLLAALCSPASDPEVIALAQALLTAFFLSSKTQSKAISSVRY
jgi:hypothetical protein